MARKLSPKPVSKPVSKQVSRRYVEVLFTQQKEIDPETKAETVISEYRIAVIIPPLDYVLRRSSQLESMATIDLNETNLQKVERFYGHPDLLEDFLTRFVRDPDNLDFHLIVRDNQIPEEGQVRLSDWNPAIDPDLVLSQVTSQKLIYSLLTPQCVAFFAAMFNVPYYRVIPDKTQKDAEKKEEEKLDVFLEPPVELAKDTEDMVLERGAELPERSDRSEERASRDPEGPA
jgi:hypothetical protein